jgi:nitroreductase
MNLTDTQRLQLAHASVRRFEARPIDDTVLRDLLRCGQAAASSSFVQAYSVVRVTDPDVRRTIADTAGGQPWIESAPEFLVFCADLARVERACARAGREPLEGQAEHGVAAIVDVALMAQNLFLAAESRGLGGVYIGGIRNAPDRVAELLVLPELVIPVFGMCLGWPAERNAVKPRQPVDMILHQDRYRPVEDRELDAYDAVMAAYLDKRSANARRGDWSTTTARAIQDKKREHLLPFLQARGFFRR